MNRTRFSKEGDVKTGRGFVEEDFGNGAVKEGEFLVSLARRMRYIAGFFGLVSSWLIFDYGC